MNSSVALFNEILARHQTFVLTTHVNPDGDALGSELAMARFLRKSGKTVTIINHSETTSYLKWLDEKNDIRAYLPERDLPAIQSADAILVMDTNQPDRLRSMEEAVLNSKAAKIIIDHHLEPHPFAQQKIVDTEATSTGEIVFQLIEGVAPGLL
ncbi:MAG TPA: DHH family phosphoesterase, partial [Bacteroidota bacterium]|nr:DHH family phosphoesterase [Bacteroidota bacterium]